MEKSPVEKQRLQYKPKLPPILTKLKRLHAERYEKIAPVSEGASDIHALFPLTASYESVRFVEGEEVSSRPLTIGCVLSGGQAAGGHNVIIGLFDALKTLHPDARLYGFLNGPSGIIDNDAVELTTEFLAPYRNTGGFDMIGSGRTKIETEEQFRASLETAKALKLDGLVIIGGDDSNTNAALLAEYFQKQGQETVVVGVPKTIDGDLKNENVEISFGFDTACKTYSELIGNILRDSLSAKKYYHFIKLMGRSASHIALECALQTHPNLTLLSEEVAAKGWGVREVTGQIADLLCARAEEGKNYGGILIPEGLIEFFPDFKVLISEINRLLGGEGAHAEALKSKQSADEKVGYISALLTPESRKCYEGIPQSIQLQLILDRDPHGNVKVAQIETERLLIESVRAELKRRKDEGRYKGKFNAQPHYLGYEGRSCFPSNFDADYCYALGHVAVLLIHERLTGFICSVKNLSRPSDQWEPLGIPLATMMTMAERKGKMKPVIDKALVELKGPVFEHFANHRDQWRLEDDYRYPGPIQFFGPQEIADAMTFTLQLEHQVPVRG